MKYAYKLRQGGKRHGVNRRRSQQDREKHRRAMLAVARFKAQRVRWLAMSKLYWAGVAADWETAARMVDEARRSASCWLARLSAFLARPGTTTA